jgi:hypothetical protein
MSLAGSTRVAATWEFAPPSSVQSKLRGGWPLYASPSESAAVVGTVPRSQPFTVSATQGLWARLALPSGVGGWAMTTHNGTK